MVIHSGFAADSPGSDRLLDLPVGEVHLWRQALAGRPAPDLSTLSAGERERGGRFVFDHDRHRHGHTRVLLRALLSRYAPVAPAEWVFSTNAHGRPRIAAPDLATALHFNLSHSRDWLLCAVAREPRVGVDVEARVPPDFRRLAGQVMARAELAWLDAASDAGAAGARFLALWTLKEAYSKALGMGLALPPEGYALLPEGETTARLLQPAALADGAGDWTFERGELGDGHCYALAVAGRAVRVRHWREP